MAYDTSRYNPYAYTGAGPTSTTQGSGGVGGALSNGSVDNATTQMKPPSGDPYSDAIQHTMNWMSYVMPGAQNGAAPTQVGQVPLSVTQQTPTPGQLPPGSPTQVGQVPNSSQMRASQMTAPTPQYAPTTPGNDPFVDMWGGGLSDSQRAAKIQPNPNPDPNPDPNPNPSPNPDPNPTPNPNPRGGRPATPGGISDEDIINGLVTNHGLTPEYAQEILTRAREYAATGPEWSWLQSRPEVLAMYTAEMGQGGEQMDFAEWIVRNRDSLQEYGVQDWESISGQGYQRWADRLANSGGPNGDTWVGWVTPQHVKDYDEWWRAENAAGRPGLSFWEWAGGVNKQPEPEPKPRERVDQPWTGGPPTTTGGPTPPDDGDDYLQRLIDSLREQGSIGRDASLRQFRHEAGLSGLNDTGAYNPALGSLIQQSLADENSAIYEIMHASSEAERQRALQKYLGELQAKTSTDVASIGAGASMYGDNLRYQLGMSQQDLDRYLGMAGLDVTREGNYLNYNTDQMRAIIDYISTLLQSQNPGNIFNGMPDTGGIIVH